MDFSNAMVLKRAETEQEIGAVRTLWVEYWETLGLPFTFQNFGEQLRTLPGEFILMLAMQGGEPAGTVALRPLRIGVCEVKRLYVPARFRGRGLGRRLLQEVIRLARELGYAEMYCDTLKSMHEAARLYESAGFEHVEPYSNDPTPGAIYFRLALGEHGAA